MDARLKSLKTKRDVKVAILRCTQEEHDEKADLQQWYPDPRKQSEKGDFVRTKVDEKF